MYISDKFTKNVKSQIVSLFINLQNYICEKKIYNI